MIKANKYRFNINITSVDFIIWRQSANFSGNWLCDWSAKMRIRQDDRTGNGSIISVWCIGGSIHWECTTITCSQIKNAIIVATFIIVCHCWTFSANPPTTITSIWGMFYRGHQKIWCSAIPEVIYTFLLSDSGFF